MVSELQVHQSNGSAGLWLLFSSSPVEAQSSLQRPRWSETLASERYQHQLWLVGSNFLPTSAVNELEMWQAETFDPQEIDKELGWAESLRMNTMCSMQTDGRSGNAKPL